jgi:arylsulfatase A-like enzyme
LLAAMIGLLTVCAQHRRRKPLNILLIVMDTVRADHLSCYGYERVTSRYVDRIAREGVLFTQAFSAAPWTLPSHASLFTGLYPSRHAAHHEHQLLNSGLMTLAEVLQEKGYRTAGFSMNAHIGHEKGFSQGFSHYYEAWNQGIISEQKKAVVINREVKNWLRDTEDPSRPFFVFINFLNAHLPYSPPDAFFAPFLRDPKDAGRAAPWKKLGISFARKHHIGEVSLSDDDVYFLNALYDGEIAYVDMLIGDLYDHLRETGRLDETCLVLTSDHGENLGDHGLMDHQFCLYDSLLSVPLILRAPALFPAGEEVRAPVSLVDLFPSLLEICRVPFEGPYSLDGASFLKDRLKTGRQAVFAEYFRHEKLKAFYAKNYPGFDFTPLDRRLKSLRQGRWKYIWGSDGRDELYDMIKDPEEKRNLIEAYPDRAAAMKGLIREKRKAMKPVSPLEKTRPLKKSTEENLKALGYLS